MTVLHKMSEAGNASLVQALLKAGEDTEAKDKNGWASLHLASREGHAAVVQTLLEHGADAAAKNDGGYTALDYAEDCDDEVKKEEVTAVLRRAVLEHARRKAEDAGEDADEAVRLAKEEMDAEDDSSAEDSEEGW
jgi:hypothetical protein